MMINLSGLCATTKLIQCRSFGLSMCSVARKFDKDPEDVPDLAKEDFLERKKVVDQVTEWSKGKWVPILYGYEVCE